jgi:hypothetical protein
MNEFKTKIKQTVALCLAMVVGFLVSACSTVPVDLAAGLAPEVRATLNGSSPVFLMQVDDARGLGESGFNYQNLSGNYMFYLSPGVHTLIVGYKYLPKRLMLAVASSPQGVNYDRVSTQLGRIQFEAKAGHSYTLVGEDTWETWKVSIQDTTSGMDITNLPNFTGGTLTTRRCVSTREGTKCDYDFAKEYATGGS